MSKILWFLDIDGCLSAGWPRWRLGTTQEGL